MSFNSPCIAFTYLVLDKHGRLIKIKIKQKWDISVCIYCCFSNLWWNSSLTFVFYYPMFMSAARFIEFANRKSLNCYIPLLWQAIHWNIRRPEKYCHQCLTEIVVLLISIAYKQLVILVTGNIEIQCHTFNDCAYLQKQILQSVRKPIQIFLAVD